MLWKKDYRKLREEEKGDLSVEDLKRIQLELLDAKVKRISYIGGEPFLHEYILELSAHAVELGFYTASVTNGNAFDEKKIEEIVYRNLFKAIVFSIDGPENIHDFIRGKKGAFQKALWAANFFRKIKNKAKKRFPKIYVYCTVSSLNYKYIYETFKIALSLNANKFRLQQVSALNKTDLIQAAAIVNLPKPGWHAYINENYLTKEQKEIVFKTIRKIKSCGFSMKMEVEASLEGRKNNICHFVGKNIVITACGKVLICPMLTSLEAGDLKKQSLKKILMSKSEMALSLLQKAQNTELPICQKCCVEKINI